MDIVITLKTIKRPPNKNNKSRYLPVLPKEGVNLAGGISITNYGADIVYIKGSPRK